MRRASADKAIRVKRQCTLSRLLILQMYNIMFILLTKYGDNLYHCWEQHRYVLLQCIAAAFLNVNTLSLHVSIAMTLYWIVDRFSSRYVSIFTLVKWKKEENVCPIKLHQGNQRSFENVKVWTKPGNYHGLRSVWYFNYVGWYRSILIYTQWHINITLICFFNTIPNYCK